MKGYDVEIKAVVNSARRKFACAWLALLFCISVFAQFPEIQWEAPKHQRQMQLNQQQMWGDSMSRAKADVVLSHFDSIQGSKLLFSIDDKYFYVLLNESSFMREYVVIADSFGKIVNVKPPKKSRRDKRLLKSTKPFELDKYDTDYTTESSNFMDFTFGRLVYFVVKDGNGKRYGEFRSFMPAKNAPIDLKLWAYIVRKLSEDAEIRDSERKAVNRSIVFSIVEKHAHEYTEDKNFLVFSILGKGENKSHLIVIEDESFYRELYIRNDSLANIKNIEKRKANKILKLAFNKKKYHTGYKDLDDLQEYIGIHGNEAYFCFVDKDKNRYGESFTNVFAPLIDRDVHFYLLVRITQNISNAENLY